MSIVSVNHKFIVEGYVYNLESSETINITDSIINISIRKRFFTESFPLVILELKTTEKIRNLIRDNDCKVNLKVSYYNMDSGESEGDENITPVPEGSVFDVNLRVYQKPFTTTSSKKDIDSSEGENSQSESVPVIYYKIATIPEDCISKNEGAFNMVLKDAEPIDAIVNMLSSVNVINPKIQNSDNKEKYRNIIIPPLSIVPAIKMIQDYYNVYDCGLALFFDMDATYCYSPVSKNRPDDNIFEINVLPNISTGDVKNNQKLVVDSDTNDISVYLNSLPTFSNNEKLTKHAKGSETVFYTYDETFNLSQRVNSDSDSYSKVRYLWNDKINKKFETEFDETYNHTASMQLLVEDLNPELITPYTKFNINASDYPEASGEYCTSEISYSLSTQDFKIYKSSMVIMLIKK